MPVGPAAAAAVLVVIHTRFCLINRSPGRPAWRTVGCFGSLASLAVAEPVKGTVTAVGTLCCLPFLRCSRLNGRMISIAVGVEDRLPFPPVGVVAVIFRATW